MYQTIKIRLRLSINQLAHLQSYEAIYHEQIQNLLTQFRAHPTTLGISSLYFDSSINTYSQWTVYQIALRLYRGELCKKTFLYQRSSSWSPQSFHIEGGNLTLHYGGTFLQLSDSVILCPLDDQLHKLKENRVIRMDLIHDEKFWFANFLVYKNDENT